MSASCTSIITTDQLAGETVLTGRLPPFPGAAQSSTELADHHEAHFPRVAQAGRQSEEHLGLLEALHVGDPQHRERPGLVEPFDRGRVEIRHDRVGAPAVVVVASSPDKVTAARFP